MILLFRAFGGLCPATYHGIHGKHGEKRKNKYRDIDGTAQHVPLAGVKFKLCRYQKKVGQFIETVPRRFEEEECFNSISVITSLSLPTCFCDASTRQAVVVYFALEHWLLKESAGLGLAEGSITTEGPI